MKKIKKISLELLRLVVEIARHGLAEFNPSGAIKLCNEVRDEASLQNDDDLYGASGDILTVMQCIKDGALQSNPDKILVEWQTAQAGYIKFCNNRDWKLRD